MWPAGCQDKAQTIDSWAASIAPTSLSAPTDQNIIEPSEPPLAKIPIRFKKAKLIKKDNSWIKNNFSSIK